MLWMSPECTNHSNSKGIKLLNQQQLTLWTDRDDDPFVERSRATMRDVVRWTEAKQDQGHPFQLVFVENVTQVTLWRDYDAWLKAMHKLGYEHKTIYFNSMFAPALPSPVPQSRDRWYTVFYRRGNKAPDLDLRPAAFCQHCAREVQSVQSWNNPARKRGVYKKQYVYRCPNCAKEVVPHFAPASTFIDWSLPAPRIGDREALGKRSLKAKTLHRVELGLQRSVPPAFLLSYYGNAIYRSVNEPVGTCTSRDRHALVSMPSSPYPEVEDCGFRMLTMNEVKRAMGFTEDYTIVCSSQREGVRQCGLAVTPAAAYELVRRGIESLGYSVPTPQVERVVNEVPA
jgi:DNA (cytosine-5)-methyltransferase 1